VTSEISKCTFADYVATPGVNCTILDYVRQSPMHAKHYMDGGMSEETPALRLGSLVHAVMFEPDTITRHYAVKPEGMSFATVEGKKWKADNAGKIPVSWSEFSDLKGMIESLLAHPKARAVFERGAPEVALFGEFENYHAGQNVKVKARLDWLSESNYLPDLKTCRDASPRGFARAIEDNWYHMRAAFYLDLFNRLVDEGVAEGPKKESFIFVAVENAPPYAVGVYEIDEGAMFAGRSEYHRLLSLYCECVQRGEWPGYSQEIEVLSLRKARQ